MNRRKYIICGVIELAIIALSLRHGKYGLLGIGFWSLLNLLVCFSDLPVWKASYTGTSVQRWITACVCIFTCLVAVLPQGLSPTYNGEAGDYRNQYELMTERILEGHIDFDYGDEHNLDILENPYDYYAREAYQVEFHWDHAYYNGHYYMYFGIVPLLLTFLPYRVLTGHALTTYHSTQIFTVVAIVGLFMLLGMLVRKYFKKMPFLAYLSASVAISVLTVWYTVSAPALYCTAIIAGVALEIWSLYFFMKGLFVEPEHHQMRHLILGALFGALVFGCRPPVGMANIILIPFCLEFIRQHKKEKGLFKNIFFVALPYLLIAAGLMYYNYIRFDSFTEFGQSYQLTVTDQHGYTSFTETFNLKNVILGILDSFFAFHMPSTTFPYFLFNGIITSYPALLTTVVLLSRKSRTWLKERHLGMTVLFIFLAVIIVIFSHVQWSPYLLERYHSDLYYLVGIIWFIGIGVYFETHDLSNVIKNRMVVVLSFSMILVCLLYFLTPNDFSWAYTYPWAAEQWTNALLLFK